MSPAGTMARVYEALKVRVMTGAFAPGERIDPAKLSVELHASVTPIRDALWRLAGERLVESWTHEGFRQPSLTEAGLRDLYRWHEDVLRVVLRTLDRRGARLDEAPTFARDAPFIEAGTAFAWLAEQSSNLEHAAAMASLADRLALIRAFEAQVIAESADPCDLVEAAMSGRWADARRWVASFHTLRVRQVPRPIALLHRRPA